jgi:hypothetical protein
MPEAEPDDGWLSLITDLPERGTEGGVIVLDDVHDLGARITLEKFDEGGGGAITCGIYGWMMHTRFFDTEDSARHAFEEMKIDMGAILWRIPLESDLDPSKALHVRTVTKKAAITVRRLGAVGSLRRLALAHRHAAPLLPN